MFLPDLSAWPSDDGDVEFKNVGWLAKDQPFSVGRVASEIIAALRGFVAEAWKPWVCGGVHLCEFCPPEGPWTADKASGSEIFVPARGVIYVAPVLILHYVEAHQYHPPNEFIDALMSCPRQRSEAWRELMKQSQVFREHRGLTTR